MECFGSIKLLFTTLALTLLLVAALFMLTRHENSGWIVFESDRDDDLPAIYVMAGDDGARRNITPSHSCATRPRWSPNAEWIVSLDACAAGWNMLLVHPGASAALTKPLDVPAIDDMAWSPDSQWLLITESHQRAYYIVDPGTGSSRLFTEGYVDAHWSPDGEWLYARPFPTIESSLDRIQVQTGLVEPLLPLGKVLTNPSWSPNAAQIALGIATDEGDELFLMNPDNGDLKRVTIDLPIPEFRMPRWSPNGEWIAFWGGEPSAWFVYRIRPDGRDLQPLSEHMQNLSDLQWSPNGEWLLFAADHENQRSIFRVRADGSAMQNLGPGDSPHYAPISGEDWHPARMVVAALVILPGTTLWRFRR